MKRPPSSRVLTSRGMMGRFQFDSTEVGVVLGIVRKTLWHLSHPQKGRGGEGAQELGSANTFVEEGEGV